MIFVNFHTFPNTYKSFCINTLRFYFCILYARFTRRAYKPPRGGGGSPRRGALTPPFPGSARRFSFLSGSRRPRGGVVLAVHCPHNFCVARVRPSVKGREKIFFASLSCGLLCSVVLLALLCHNLISGRKNFSPSEFRSCMRCSP